MTHAHRREKKIPWPFGVMDAKARKWLEGVKDKHLIRLLAAEIFTSCRQRAMSGQHSLSRWVDLPRSRVQNLEGSLLTGRDRLHYPKSALFIINIIVWSPHAILFFFYLLIFFFF